MSVTSLAAAPAAVALPNVVLVIDFDPFLGRQIAHQLCLDGYEAFSTQSTSKARQLAARHPLAAVVLGDLQSPRSWLDVLEEIRRPTAADSPWDPTVPVLVTSTRTGKLDLARAFEAGADDFMNRPAPHVELRSRLRAVLRRVHPTDTVPESLRVGALMIDLLAHTVTMHEQRLDLRRLEFDLLAHLASDPERVFSKHELLSSVWGYRSEGSTRTVDSHASRVRRKLETADGDQRWVINIWGIGYRLKLYK